MQIIDVLDQVVEAGSDPLALLLVLRGVEASPPAMPVFLCMARFTTTSTALLSSFLPLLLLARSLKAYEISFFILSRNRAVEILLPHVVGLLTLLLVIDGGVILLIVSGGVVIGVGIGVRGVGILLPLCWKPRWP